jgi:hypothetical protein
MNFEVLAFLYDELRELCVLLIDISESESKCTELQEVLDGLNYENFKMRRNGSRI